MSITYPARSSAAAELVLPLTDYRDAYGNRMLTDRMPAVTMRVSETTDEVVILGTQEGQMKQLDLYD